MSTFHFYKYIPLFKPRAVFNHKLYVYWMLKAKSGWTKICNQELTISELLITEYESFLACFEEKQITFTYRLFDLLDNVDIARVSSKYQRRSCYDSQRRAIHHRDSVSAGRDRGATYPIFKVLSLAGPADISLALIYICGGDNSG